MSDQAQTSIKLFRGGYLERLKDGAQWASIKLVQTIILAGGLFVAWKLIGFLLLLLAADAVQTRQNAAAAAGYLAQAVEQGYLPKPDANGKLPPKPSPSPSPSPSASPTAAPSSSPKQ